jgi:hypothetical protein
VRALVLPLPPLLVPSIATASENTGRHEREDELHGPAPLPLRPIKGAQSSARARCRLSAPSRALSPAASPPTHCRRRH